MKKNKIKIFFVLHLLLLLMALSSMFSKLAGMQSVSSLNFFAFYGLMLFLLLLYSFGWQQIIKRIPLSVAYANKGITLVWSLILGAVIFNEQITPNRVLGCLLTIAGILLFVWDSKEEAPND